MTSALITDHADQAVARIVTQFRDSSNLLNLIQSFCASVQDIENVQYDLLINRWLETAEGAQLDELGDLVGETRQARNDDDYRAAIFDRIFLNASFGEPERLITALKIITEASDVDLVELSPATAILTGDGATVPIDIGERLESLAPAGVLLSVIATYGETPFAFADDGAAGFYSDPPVGQGFSESFPAFDFTDGTWDSYLGGSVVSANSFISDSNGGGIGSYPLTVGHTYRLRLIGTQSTSSTLRVGGGAGATQYEEISSATSFDETVEFTATISGRLGLHTSGNGVTVTITGFELYDLADVEGAFIETKQGQITEVFN